MTRQFLKITEACDVLACSRSQLYRWLYAGEIPFVKLGRSTRIAVSALEEFVAKRIQEASDRPDYYPRRG